MTLWDRIKIITGILIILLCSTVFSQNPKGGLYNFYQDIYEQDEKKLYDYLIAELEDWGDYGSDSDSYKSLTGLIDELAKELGDD